MKYVLNDDWRAALQPELDSAWFAVLSEFVEQEYAAQTVYPLRANIFRALNETPLKQVKVVILGQDPYHGTYLGEPQAQGLSFSVPKGMKLPPSLRNIFQELAEDLGSPLRTNGDLSDWAAQGVLLLNATLTVRAQEAGSHQNKGWETLTDAIITTLSAQNEHVVFILWGSYAQHKKQLINTNKHLCIESSHPSPLSAYRGFFGSRPFSTTNQYLVQQGIAPIRWNEE